MTICEFGDVVLVPFPFTDQSTTKKRPAVVISSRAYNANRPDLIVLAITSQVNTLPALAERIVLKWREAGLVKASALKPAIATIDQRIVVKHLGQLAQEDCQSLRAMIAEMLG